MTETPTTAQTDAETERPIDDPETTDAVSDPATDESESAAADPDSATDGTDPSATAGTTTDSGGGLDPQSETVRRYLAWAALGICSILAVFALIQFYGSVTAAIDLWVAPKYQPLMGAAFNLAVLLASLIGVSLVVRELN
ncbi:hypothetical protein [Haloterrigena alkaliphila]|uniref:DUF8060 domain-containing protein n=1 Tax=Haloterrigena alkaliphila TaxID=2816475 RepID=A0A8A2VEJ8_9EURY|nr:hypothetical protein [Haloterrigena alkaliphila]QSW99931.1 hypothetical protein J0X25_02920 [Haloterrigena alkaliphila]